MRVLGYTWAGVRSADLKSAAHFFGDVLGLFRVHDGNGMVQFELPSGQLFEVFGSESRYYPLHACPVLAFKWRMYARPGRSWSHGVSNLSPMSRATNQRPGLTFAVPTATFTSFGRRCDR
jgi:hypothetical protein